MTVYCDTSVMVSAFTAERHSVVVQQWLARQTGEVAISPWVVTEFSGALAMKRRMAVVDAGAWNAVMEGWRRFRRERTRLQPVADIHFEQAALLMDRGDLKLRSGDPLHLAIATCQAWTLATLDHDLAEAARTVGVSVDTVLI